MAMPRAIVVKNRIVRELRKAGWRVYSGHAASPRQPCDFRRTYYSAGSSVWPCTPEAQAALAAFAASGWKVAPLKGNAR